MENPQTPPAAGSPAKSKPPSPDQDVHMTGTEPIARQPFDHHPPDLFPEAIRKAFPQGVPVIGTRTSEQEEALQAKKTEILKTMTLQEAQARYKQIADTLVESLKEVEKNSEDWKAEKEKLIKNHEMEEKVLRKMLSAPQDD